MSRLQNPAKVIETEPAGLTGSGDTVFRATDVAGGLHLFIPVDEQEIEVDTQSSGVILISQRLVLGDAERLYADLVCHDQKLQSVFEPFTDDVLRRVKITDDPVAEVRAALSDWRALLRTVSGDVSWSVLVGLRGELEVLANMVSLEGRGAFNVWTGPMGSARDFEGGVAALEVKSTTRQSGYAIGVHGLQQMTPPDGCEFGICHVRLTRNEQHRSVNGVLDWLVAAGLDRSLLEDRATRAGWSADQPGWDVGFEVLEVNTWDINDDFPGLRQDRVPARHLLGIESLAYELDLAAGGKPLDSAEQERLFRRVCQK